MNPLLFTEPAFLFFFAPLVLTSYWLVPASWRNSLLLAASLVLYAWGENRLVSVLLVSIVLNWACGLAVQGRSAVLCLGVVGNLLLLGAFQHKLAGVSFYSFIGISYLVDLYRRDVSAPSGLLPVGLLLSMFPHLVAGPIVRMTDLGGQFGVRAWNTAMVSEGVRRFVIGLGKKVLIANTLASVPDGVFGVPGVPAGFAWLGLVCYTVQIYFDFSGYSDMAIGLAGMLGFRFPENFNYPYAARSVTEFWRRWHITLSSWLRDYLFFPLGARTGSLLVVFLLCGLWHGFSWTFALWGLWHGLWLALERAARIRWHTMVVVALGWVLFRSATVADAGLFLGALAGLGGAVEFGLIVSPAVYLALAIGIVLAIPLRWPRVPVAVEWVGLGLVFLLSLSSIAGGTYRPFLYFRF